MLLSWFFCSYYGISGDKSDAVRRQVMLVQEKRLEKLSNYLANSIDLKGWINCSAGQGNLHLDSELKSLLGTERREPAAIWLHLAHCICSIGRAGSFGYTSILTQFRRPLLLLTGNARVRKTLPSAVVSHLSTNTVARDSERWNIVGPSYEIKFPC